MLRKQIKNYEQLIYSFFLIYAMLIYAMKHFNVFFYFGHFQVNLLLVLTSGV